MKQFFTKIDKHKQTKQYHVLRIVKTFMLIIIVLFSAYCLYVIFMPRGATASPEQVLRAKLGQNNNLLQSYNLLYESYPLSLDENNCPISPIIDNNFCLSLDEGYGGYLTHYTYYSNGDTFTLTGINESSHLTYSIDEKGVILKR